jgi:hypothetical protein
MQLENTENTNYEFTTGTHDSLTADTIILRGDAILTNSVVRSYIEMYETATISGVKARRLDIYGSGGVTIDGSEITVIAAEYPDAIIYTGDNFIGLIGLSDDDKTSICTSEGYETYKKDTDIDDLSDDCDRSYYEKTDCDDNIYIFYYKK